MCACACKRVAQRTLSRLVGPKSSSLRDLRERESNAARPGVEPGDPQHEAEGWTRCPRGRENSKATQRVAQVFLYGKAKAPPK